MKSQGKPKNRARDHLCSRKKLEIVVRYVHAPDFEMRLSRAIDILLDASTRRSTKRGKDKKKSIEAIRITKEEI